MLFFFLLVPFSLPPFLSWRVESGWGVVTGYCRSAFTCTVPLCIISVSINKQDPGGVL